MTDLERFHPTVRRWFTERFREPTPPQREGTGAGELPDETRVVHVSPLKALSADIHRDLAEPRRGIRVSAADPLDLIGTVTPGERVPARPDRRIGYGKGVPVWVLEGDDLRPLTTATGGREEPAEARRILRRRPVPPTLRRYVRA